MSNKRLGGKNSGRASASKNAAKMRPRADECSSGSNSEQRRVNATSYDPAEFNSLKAQLSAYNLEKREVVGDGNCLFRSIADQLDGSQRGHLRYRREVCDFMQSHRADFEPFIDFDDAEGNARTFDEYIKVLQQNGTYGDQLSIVAFSRLYKLVVVIHQFGMNVWSVDGTTDAANGTTTRSGSNTNPVRQLHILYHPHGNHYDSLRPIGDRSDKPTSIFIVPNQKGDAASNSGASRSGRNDKQKQQKGSRRDEDWREEEEIREQLAYFSYAEAQDASSDLQAGAQVATADTISKQGAQASNDAAYDDDQSRLEEEILRLQLAEIENSAPNASDYSVDPFNACAAVDQFAKDSESGDSDRDQDTKQKVAADTKSSKANQQQANARALREQKRLEKKKRAEQRHRERVMQMNEAENVRPGSNRDPDPLGGAAADDAQLLITNANIIAI